MEITICNMQKADIPKAARLEEICFADPWSQNALKESLESAQYLILSAFVQGEFAGYVSTYQAADELSIANIAVFPEWRNKGVADKLLKRLDEIAIKRNLYGITLEVRVSNQPAINLYKKNGYESQGVRKNFYSKPTEDALIMWKYFQK